MGGEQSSVKAIGWVPWRGAAIVQLIREDFRMGREIRRVPPNWQHPRYTEQDGYRGKPGEFKPMFKTPYSEAIAEWIKNHDLWLKGEHPDQLSMPDSTAKYKFYAEWDGGPPSVETYAPDWEEELTWWAVYETVSEGTPITPSFATQQELVDWLSSNRDFWDYQWTREQAERFVFGAGWAPSLIGKSNGDGAMDIKPGFAAD